MESPFKGKTGLTRLWNALHYSIEGIADAYRLEDAFRQEVFLALVLIPVSVGLRVWLHLSATAHALMVASVLLVLIVELINSAIEATVDRVGLERHKLSKRAKDIGSASVLVSLINVMAVWACILIGEF